MEVPLESDFVTVDVALEDSLSQMQWAIEMALTQWGDPLRWAVTGVDMAKQVARVEAIVLLTHRNLTPPVCPTPVQANS